METLASTGGQIKVRIGDQERDACVDALNEHHARGRLSVDELDRRQRLALAAITDADLSALLLDLPHPTSARTPVVVAEDWWSLDPKVRAGRMARWAAAPFSLVVGGVLVASTVNYSEERQFVAGFTAAGVGYVTHLVLSRRPD
nr:DUF1707 domain-containing protein [uncultured Nocardioides sp.]